MCSGQFAVVKDFFVNWKLLRLFVLRFHYWEWGCCTRNAPNFEGEPSLLLVSCSWALCPSCHVAELPDHWVRAEMPPLEMFSSISEASRLPQARAGEGGWCWSLGKQCLCFPSSARQGKALSTVTSGHLLSDAKIWQEWNAQEPLVLTDRSGQQEKMLGHLLGFPCL